MKLGSAKSLPWQKVGLWLFGAEWRKREGWPWTPETLGMEDVLLVEMVSWDMTVYQNSGQIMQFRYYSLHSRPSPLPRPTNANNQSCFFAQINCLPTASTIAGKPWPHSLLQHQWQTLLPLPPSVWTLLTAAWLSSAFEAEGNREETDWGIMAMGRGLVLGAVDRLIMHSAFCVCFYLVIVKSEAKRS